MTFDFMFSGPDAGMRRTGAGFKRAAGRMHGKSGQPGPLRGLDFQKTPTPFAFPLTIKRDGGRVIRAHPFHIGGDVEVQSPLPGLV